MSHVNPPSVRSGSSGTPGAGDVHVWQAPAGLRLGVTAVCAVLVLMSAFVLFRYGYLAVIGVGLVLALVVRTWWLVLRPSLTAGPQGVHVVSDRTPVDVSWSEIRRCDATAAGLKIVCSGGREVLARYPQQPSRPTGVTTEAEATAAYLAQRAAWERKPTGPAPVYVAPPPPPKPAK
jgi:hypothetical protein